MDALYGNPWVLGGILIMPLLIIGLAKALKRFKEKRAEKQAQTPQ